MTVLKRPGGELANRPLHFIWIVDCSGSMYGEKIGSVNHAIQSTIPDMREAALNNPNAQLLVRTLKFSTGASWVTSNPVNIEDFAWDDLEAGGVTDLGQAFFLLYGTTLVGLMVMPTFLFALQLGDGDIVYVNGGEVSHVLRCDRILDTETYSLSKLDSRKHAIASVRRMERDDNLPFAFMLATDDFSNSHKDEHEFHRTCSDYFKMICSHGIRAVNENLKFWLTETSAMGCGDDITLLIAYFDNNTEEEPTPIEIQPDESDISAVSDDSESLLDI